MSYATSVVLQDVTLQRLKWQIFLFLPSSVQSPGVTGDFLATGLSLRLHPQSCKACSVSHTQRAPATPSDVGGRQPVDTERNK